MNNTIISKVWKIRGNISKAIFAKDVEKFNKESDKFFKIFENREHLNTFSTVSIFTEYNSAEEMNHDKETNFALIAFDLQRLKKALIKQPSSTTLTYNSVLEALWHIRDIYDHTLHLIKEEQINNEQITELVSGIYLSFYRIMDFYECIENEYAAVELSDIDEIFENDIIANLEKFYDGSAEIPKVTVYGEG